MGKEQFLAYLKAHYPEQVLLDEPMSRHTTFKVGGPADLFVMPRSTAQVQELILKTREAGLPLTVIGNGSNLLVRDKGIRGVVLQLGNSFRQLIHKDTHIIAQTGISLSALSNQAAEWGLSGLEFACGIPGTLGGAVVMNAGAYGGEIGPLVLSVEAVTLDGKLLELSNEDLDFAYRHTTLQDINVIVLQVELALTPGNKDDIHSRMAELTQKRITKQPLNLPSAGSTFKRPTGYYAAALIDQAGLRGYRVGDAQVSEKHTGFVVNVGNATSADVLQLMKDVRDRVHEFSGVWLEPEVRILGEK